MPAALPSPPIVSSVPTQQPAPFAPLQPTGLTQMANVTSVPSILAHTVQNVHQTPSVHNAHPKLI